MKRSGISCPTVTPPRAGQPVTATPRQLEPRSHFHALAVRLLCVEVYNLIRRLVKMTAAYDGEARNCRLGDADAARLAR
jgi:hypothetical protein